MKSAGWLRVNKNRPCPICGKQDWCLVSRDGGAAICPRVGSGRRAGDAGWLHRLSDDAGRGPRLHTRTIVLSLGTASHRPDLGPLAAEYERDLDSGRLHQLAQLLGLSEGSLKKMRVGWSGSRSAWTFPMSDPDGTVIGIRLRLQDGRKLSVRGGHEGLFLPSTIGGRPNHFLICEGPTDAAALVQVGFLNVVGRPSCSGGTKLLLRLMEQQKPEEVTIVADGDEPGKRGADQLASALLIHVPMVRIIAPPEGIKDARAWLRVGGTREDIDHAIAAAPVQRLTIQVGPKRGTCHG